MLSTRVIIILVFVMLVITACVSVSGPGTSEKPTPLPCDTEVPWDQAIEILHTGRVESVTQLHSLEVSFMLEDGCRITTVEPRIDEIFKEIDKCVDSCGVTSFATE